MKIYGLLLDELTFKPGKTSQDVIDYYENNLDTVPGQIEACTDRNGENPYLAVMPVFTHNACDFQNLFEIRDFLVRFMKPFVDMDNPAIEQAIGDIFIADDIE